LGTRRPAHGSFQFLTEGSDADLIEQGKARFNSLTDNYFDGFEVWDGARRLYCFPENPDAPNSN
jgi:hypothetical protein